MIEPELEDYIFGPGIGHRMCFADNCFLISLPIEHAFDVGNLVFVPVDAHERPILRCKAVLLDSGSANTPVTIQPGAGARVTLGDLDGQELRFRNNERPAARFLFYHFPSTVLR